MSGRDRRDLYNDILAVSATWNDEVDGLFGVIPDLQDRLPYWKVAVVSVTQQFIEPGAAK
jgi:hypothetical protein